MKAEGGLTVLPTNLAELIPAMTGSQPGRLRSQSLRMTEGFDDLDHVANTAKLVSKIALHTAWDTATPGSSVH